MKDRHPRGERACRPIRVLLPEEVDVALRVYIRSQGSLSEDGLRQIVLDRLSRRADDPIGGRVRRFIEDGLLDLEVHEKDDLPSPTPCEIARLGEEVRERFCGSDLCVRVLAMDRLCRPRPGLWAANSAAASLALALDGVVFDPKTSRTFYREPDLAEIPAGGEIAAARHIALLYSVGGRGLGWVTTLGMGKFGLPNLEVRDVPPNLCRSLGGFTNGIAQQLMDAVLDLADSSAAPPREILLGPEILLEGCAIDRACGGSAGGSGGGPTGSAPVRLEYTGKGRGSLEPFIEICPPGGFVGGQGVWLYDALEKLFGPERSEDRIRYFDKGEAAMEEAHRKAVARLGEIKARFQGGLRPGEALLVKHGFPWGQDCQEFMWVAVNTWKGKRLQGQLACDPIYRKDLKAGEPIELEESEVFDWLIAKEDGSYEGGSTQSLILGGGQGG